MSVTKRLIVVEAIGVFTVAIVEFALIRKHGATARTLIVVIATTVIPAIAAIGVHIWYHLRHL